MKPTIKRGSYLHFYNAKDFGLSVVKDRSEFNHLTFNMGGIFTSVLVNRKEAAHVLKKFKTLLDKARKDAKLSLP